MVSDKRSRHNCLCHPARSRSRKAFRCCCHRKLNLWLPNRADNAQYLLLLPLQLDDTFSSLPSCGLKDFKVDRVLGTGSFGRVSLAQHIATGRICAIKALSKANIVRNQQVCIGLLSVACGTVQACMAEPAACGCNLQYLSIPALTVRSWRTSLPACHFHSISQSEGT